MSHTSPWTQWGGVLNRPCQNQDVLRRISLGSPSGILRDPLEIRDDVKMRKVLVFVKILIDGRTASDRAGYTKSGRRCHKRTLRQFRGKRWRAHYIPLPDQQRHT